MVETADNFRSARRHRLLSIALLAGVCLSAAGITFAALPARGNEPAQASGSASSVKRSTLSSTSRQKAPAPRTLVNAPVASHRGELPDNPADVLYDQYDNLSQSAVSSQNFETQSDPYDDQAADDFDIGAGETWLIDRVDVAGAYTPGYGPANSVNVFFYAGAGNLPGAPVFTQTEIIPAGLAEGNFSIALTSPAALTQGHYWISVQANQAVNPNGQWFWRNRRAKSDNFAAWRNPGGAFGRGACTFNRAAGCWNAAYLMKLPTRSFA